MLFCLRSPRDKLGVQIPISKLLLLSYFSMQIFQLEHIYDGQE